MSVNNTTCGYSDIINNILNSDVHRAACIAKAKSYEATQGDNSNRTELIRFSRHISLETYFKNITNENTKNEDNSNMKTIFEELSTITNNDNIQIEDSVLVLQLSSIIDTLLNELSTSEQKIYLYRYFFMYSIEDIANICGTQDNNVQKSLSTCNSKLKELIQNNNLICDNKSLLLSISDIDDSYLLKIIDNKSASNNNAKKNKEQDSSSIKKLLTFSKAKYLNIIFAAIILVLAILNITQFIANKKTTNTSEPSSIEENFITPSGFDKRDAYITLNGVETINMEELLKYRAEEQKVEISFSYKPDYFTGRYHSLTLVDDIPLSDYIGEEIMVLKEENASFYKLMGTDSYQYIIKKYDEKYTLYYLESISLTDQESTTTSEFSISYYYLLNTFYGITNPTEIKEISVMAASSDIGYRDYNTKKVIDDSVDISNLYDNLCSIKYTGKDIGAFCTENNISLDLIWNKSVLLTITLNDGSIIDSLCYYPAGNIFIDTTDFIIYETTSANREYISNMLRFNNYVNVPRDPESWKLAFSCHLDTTDRIDNLILSANCDPNDKIHSLYIGSEYSIEKLENGKWVTPPAGSVTVTYPFSAFDQKINANYSNRYYYYIPNKYDTLGPGTYRLNITVYDSDSLDINNPNSRDYSVQFVIN